MPNDQAVPSSLHDYLAAGRSGISERLRRIAASRMETLAAVHGDGRRLMERILDFSLRGKLIRGSLVCMGHDLFRPAAAGAVREALWDAAAAMELVQSGLLVHDDIMDQDGVRRGAPTIHSLYGREAAAEGALDPAHVGEALGLCAGDACFFLAFEVLSRCQAPAAVRARILERVAGVLTAVSLAQMQDVRWGAEDREVPEGEVLSMYRWKTARYSFSVPLACGALLAEAPEAQVAALEEIGEHVGIAFQLRDDELGLFGDESEIGKPVGSDIREGKKTVLRARLLAAAPPGERERLRRLFGGDPGPGDIAHVRDLAESLGVRKAVEDLAAARLSLARQRIDCLSGLQPGMAPMLSDLADFMCRRNA